MLGLLFRNPWFAAAWALATLGSIAAFVSEGGGQEKVLKAASDIRAKRQEQARAGNSDEIVIDLGETEEEGAAGGDVDIVIEEPSPENQPAEESY